MVQMATLRKAQNGHSFGRKAILAVVRVAYAEGMRRRT